VPVSKADEYRNLANEAEQRAAAASRSEIRELHRQLARNWRELAEQADSQNGRSNLES